MSYDLPAKRCFNLDDHAEHSWEHKDETYLCPGMPTNKSEAKPEQCANCGRVPSDYYEPGMCADCDQRQKRSEASESGGQARIHHNDTKEVNSPFEGPSERTPGVGYAKESGGQSDLLQAAKYFISWVDDVWGSAALSPTTLGEYNRAKVAIQQFEAREVAKHAPLSGEMYEDQLPADMPKADYDEWFKRSRVDGVRIGPKYPAEHAPQPRLAAHKFIEWLKEHRDEPDGFKYEKLLDFLGEHAPQQSAKEEK